MLSLRNDICPSSDEIAHTDPLWLFPHPALLMLVAAAVILFVLLFRSLRRSREGAEARARAADAARWRLTTRSELQTELRDVLATIEAVERRIDTASSNGELRRAFPSTLLRFGYRRLRVSSSGYRYTEFIPLQVSPDEVVLYFEHPDRDGRFSYYRLHRNPGRRESTIMRLS